MAQKSLRLKTKDFASIGGLEVWRSVQSNDLCFVCKVNLWVLPNGHKI